ncbi:MAG: chromosome partitioning protein [Pseudomonadota bacterium]
MLRVPPGISHVVLDTPGGMHGFELARVVMFSDAIIMPVCNSVFDRESAAACHAELMTMPRIASGRCRLVTVGMRIDGRTHALQSLKEWSESLGITFLGALRESQLYVRSLEHGMTIFDLSPKLAAFDLQQWQPLLQWLQPVLYPPQAANDSSHSPGSTSVTANPRLPILTSARLSRQAEPLRQMQASASGHQAMTNKHLALQPNAQTSVQSSLKLPSFLKQANPA